MTDVVVVFCTAPPKCADSLAAKLVEEELCACVSVVPAVKSFYRWQGKVEVADEHLLVMKTTGAAFSVVRERLVALHPYDVPQVIAIPVGQGLPSYLSWVVDSVKT
jgi:periplasmic divalent cation tolerance protein